MPAIKEREAGITSRRRERIAMLKKGPGVFIYNGKGMRVEYTPTPRLIGKDEPLLGDNGCPVVDGAGRQVMKPAGRHATDEEGHVILGGDPVINLIPIKVFELRGMQFPEGERVKVDVSSLALKLRGMDCFEEVDEADPEPDPEPETEDEDEGSPVAKVPGRRAQLMSLASANGLGPERTSKIPDLEAMLTRAGVPLPE